MTTVLQSITKLPLDLQLIIFEYDPNRRIIMNQLATMLYLYVPYWYFRKGLWFMSINYCTEVALAKRRLTNQLVAASECYNSCCSGIKDSTMILKYLEVRFIYLHGGMYCNECLQKKN
jgi:hypothetical protein